MGVTIIVNYMTASHKGSGGKSPAFPDVCKTPTPAGPIPIPYPNIAQSSDLSDGSKKVKFDGEPVVLKGSKLSRSMGDEAGTVGGVASNVNMGKAQFVNYSFDVKVEGQNVCRLCDPTMQNMSSGNSGGFCHLQSPAAASADPDEIIKTACDNVTKKRTEQQSAGEEAQEKASGIIREHRSALQAYLTDENPKYVLFFRNGNEDSLKWIRRGYHPKPHSVTDGKTIKDGGKLFKRYQGEDAEVEIPIEVAAQEWLEEHPDTVTCDRAVSEFGWGPKLVSPPPVGSRRSGVVPKIREMRGIVARTSTGKVGRPEIGRGRFRGSWMTGDYDLMDVLKANEKCVRPNEHTEYELLRQSINKKLKTPEGSRAGDDWPGIQHGPQSYWITKKPRAKRDGLDKFKLDEHYKGKERFIMPAEMRKFAKRERSELKAAQAKGDFSKTIAQGRLPHPMIDDKLTVIGPGGGSYSFDKSIEDFWDALVCCGCRDPIEERKGRERRKQARESEGADAQE